MLRGTLFDLFLRKDNYTDLLVYFAFFGCYIYFNKNKMGFLTLISLILLMSIYIVIIKIKVLLNLMEIYNFIMCLKKYKIIFRFKKIKK